MLRWFRWRLCAAVNPTEILHMRDASLHVSRVMRPGFFFFVLFPENWKQTANDDVLWEILRFLFSSSLKKWLLVPPARIPPSCRLWSRLPEITFPRYKMAASLYVMETVCLGEEYKQTKEALVWTCTHTACLKLHPIHSIVHLSLYQSEVQLWNPIMHRGKGSVNPIMHFVVHTEDGLSSLPIVSHSVCVQPSFSQAFRQPGRERAWNSGMFGRRPSCLALVCLGTDRVSTSRTGWAEL